MLSEGIRKRQQRIEGFQEKIDKVMNDIFITRSHAGCSSRQIPDVGLLQYVLKQSTLSAKFCGFAKSISLCFLRTTVGSSQDND